MHSEQRSTTADWPVLSYQDWASTASALHLWTQIVGKVRLVQTPWTNHSWHVPLYLSARGLTSSPIPFGSRICELTFDFIDHALVVQSAAGDQRLVPLKTQSVAEFYESVMNGLRSLDFQVSIYTVPSEMADGIPFEKDTQERHYDPEAVTQFWRALLQMDRVFKEFRARFIGKVSPVHFFWGSFDLAVTRFSGRTAPPHPAGIPNFPDWVAREAYSHEVSSAGFWPGGPSSEAFFYSYAYPTPEGFSSTPVRPNTAQWIEALGEFVLPYDAVRASDSPDETLLEFLQSTYEAAADVANWDRAALERSLPPADRFG